MRLTLDDGRVFDEGVCTIKNISLAGALIGNLRMAKGVLPLTRVKVFLEFRSGELSGLALIGEMARCAYNKEFEIGVSFVGLDTGAMAQLEQVLEAVASK